jgi:hypothetical protein
MKTGDLVKHSTRPDLAIGIITGRGYNYNGKPFGVEVLWQCGRHSAHASNHLRLLEALCST